MAVGILAVLFALGTFSSQQAGAATSDVSLELSTNSPDMVTEVTVTFTDGDLAEDGDTGMTDDIVITFTGIVLTDVAASDISVTAMGEMYTEDANEVKDYANAVAVDTTSGTPSVDVTDEAVTFSFDLGENDGVRLTEPVVVKIKDIDDPAAAPKTMATATNAKASVKVGEAVAEESDEVGTGVVLTTNTETGGAVADVRVEVASGAPTDIGDQVTIDMGSFGLPDRIDEDDVSLRSLLDTGTQERIGTPDLVDISGSKVTLTVPDMDPDGDEEDGLNARYKVVFTKDAGVTIPTAAGDYSVSWDNPNGDTINSNTKTVATTMTPAPKSGGRNTDITLKGRAWANGTTGIYHVANVGEDKEKETFLEDVTAAKNSFDATINPTKAFTPGDNTIRAKGSDGNKEVDVTFDLIGTMEVSPATVDKGGLVKITLTDWEEGDVGQVRIGGEDVDLVTKAGAAASYPVNTSSVNEDGEVVFYVKVGEDVRLGTKTVSMLDEADKRIGSEEIEVGALSLNVTPSSAVAGQEVTVAGSGFAGSVDVTLVKVQGETAKIPSESDETTSSGRVTITFTVPDEVTHGARTVEVTDFEGNVGQADLTVPEPTVTVEPGTSKRGTTITVTGSGFPAGKNVIVTYDVDKDVDSVRTDGTGNFTTKFAVPSDADIGEDATVKASVTVGDAEYEATDTHTVPAQSITLSSETASSGQSITIAGAGFPRYSSVRVAFGSHDAIGLGVNTDGAGSFPATSVLVPGLDDGTILVRITVTGITATELLEIGAGPITTDTAIMFKDLIDAGNLERVYRYINATATWLAFDPRPEFANINDYTESTSGDAVWVKVTNHADFQGQPLAAGWNIIVLQ